MKNKRKLTLIDFILNRPRPVLVFMNAVLKTYEVAFQMCSLQLERQSEILRLQKKRKLEGLPYG
jgi:hypothetical protein